MAQLYLIGLWSFYHMLTLNKQKMKITFWTQKLAKLDRLDVMHFWGEKIGTFEKYFDG
jgi:hypothetical protein